MSDDPVRKSMTCEVIAARQTHAKIQHMNLVVSSSANATPSTPQFAGVGDALRHWRSRRRWSQQALALEVGISSRHMSCIETERAQASVAVLMGLARVLDVPLRERNRLLLLAGYAPRYAEQGFDSTTNTPALAALNRLLAAHDPYPGIVLDAQWNVVLTNSAGQLLEQLVPPALRQPQFNAFRASLHPEGLARFTLNFDAWCGYLLDTLRRALSRHHDPRLAAIEAEVLSYPNVRAVLQCRAPSETAAPPLLLPCVMQLPMGIVSMFTTLTTFGTPRDVLLEELCVELFYPADDASERLLRGLTKP